MITHDARARTPRFRLIDTADLALLLDRPDYESRMLLAELLDEPRIAPLERPNPPKSAVPENRLRAAQPR
jgi:hypothetical protein